MGADTKPNSPRILLDGQDLTAPQLRVALTSDVEVSLSKAVWAGVQKASERVAVVAGSSKLTYGINTGFGKLANTQIPAEQLATLQHNLVLSHSTGTGPLLDDAHVRLIMLLKIRSLSRGHSGVSVPVLQVLLDCLNHGIYPCIPAQGSVGASGDLAPLAHMSAALLGHGEVRKNGQRMPAARALQESGLAPAALGPKDGLALLNGTSVSAGLALAALLELEDLFCAALVTGAMTTDAAQGSDTPFDARIQAVRGHAGQARVATILRSLLRGSEIRASHITCDRVQDPYSIRCQPQVMGACDDWITFAGQKLLIEGNAVTDNPLVFEDPEMIVSGGNFHAEPVALAADTMALAMAEIGNLAERRIALLMDPATNGGLPPFLVESSGVNSGFMIAHVTAAALTSENKMLCHPASADTIPTSANQEDHVSMATHGARRLLIMCQNLRGILAIEWLAAAQGLDFHAPRETSQPLQVALAALRQVVARYDQDRFLAPDIEAARRDLTEQLVPVCRAVQ